MFDAWGISIFVGFDFHNVDVLRLKGGKELLTLLFSKLLILCIYGIYIVDHNAYSYLLRMMESCFYGYGNHNIFLF